MTSRAWSRACEPLVFLGLAALWLLPLLGQPDGFPFWVGGDYSDLLISHWPNAYWLRRALLEWGQVPLWNPQILSGAPFAADPLSGLWYPPFWLAPWLPGALGFNLVFLLHLAWAGWGASRLARSEGAGGAAALVAGAVFAGSPKLIGHIGLGHLGLVCSVAWLPWILLGAKCAWSIGPAEARSRRSVAMLAGGALGASFLADPRGAVLATVALAIVGLRAAWQARGSSSQLVGLLGRVGIVGLTATGISTALGWPLLEVLGGTTRSALTGADRLAFSVSPAGLAGLLIPDLGGWPETLTYLGLAALLLALAGLLSRAPGSGLWVAVALAGWLLALGAHTPLYLGLSELPGFGVLRVPARFLFLAALGVSCLAGLGAEALIAGRAATHRKRLRLLFVGAGSFLLLLGIGGARLAGGTGGGFLEAAVVGLLAAAAGLCSLGDRASPSLRAAVWVALVVGELAWVAQSLLVVHPASEALGERAELVRSIQATLEAGARVFSPSYSVPQQSAAAGDLELADGINPLQLSAYAGAMRSGLGITDASYSVTLPPFPTGDPAGDWGPAIEPETLGLFSIGLLASDYPLPSPELELVGQVDGVWLYRNPSARPRAWIQDGRDTGGPWRPVESWRWSPNRIEVAAEGPGILVLSEVAAPGWSAVVDGARVPVLTIEGVLRGIRLEPGTHEVVLDYKPLSVLLGAGLSLLTALAILFVEVRR